MLRGCALSLLLWAALSVAYFFWLTTVFEFPTNYWASALVGFIVLCCLGALINAKNAFRDWSLISAGRRGLRPRDGRLIAVEGTIHPVGEPLVAPFSGGQCVICEYDLSRPGRGTDSEGKSSGGSDFAGFLMTPSVIRSAAGDVRLLGFPVLEGFGKSTQASYAAARRAIDYLTTRQFEDKSGLKVMSVLAVFGDVWSDEDGQVEKNIRIGKITLPSLFTPELEAEIDRQLQADLERQAKLAQDPAQAAAAAADHEALNADEEDEDDDDDLNDDDFEGDLESTGYSNPDIPRMEEKRVEIGQTVCAIGRFNELKGGLLPVRGSATPNRLIRGTAEEFEKKSRSSIVSYLIGGLVALVIVHGATFGVMQAYKNSPEMTRHRQKVAFEAVDKGDVARLEKLLGRGMDINLKSTNDETLLMKAQDPTVVTWLIKHGADVNATDNNGRTTLMKAASGGRADIVQQLIDARANLNLRSTDYRRTALMIAVDGGHHDVAELLRQAGAEDDVATAASGKPLPEDGGPQLAACKTYIQAIHDREPAVLRTMFVTESTYDFEGVDWQLWHNTRPVQIESWTGFVRGDDATITVQGTGGGGYPVAWIYQLKRVGETWKIAREREHHGE